MNTFHQRSILGHPCTLYFQRTHTCCLISEDPVNLQQIIFPPNLHFKGHTYTRVFLRTHTSFLISEDSSVLYENFPAKIIYQKIHMHSTFLRTHTCCLISEDPVNSYLQICNRQNKSERSCITPGVPVMLYSNLREILHSFLRNGFGHILTYNFLFRI